LPDGPRRIGGVATSPAGATDASGVVVDSTGAETVASALGAAAVAAATTGSGVAAGAGAAGAGVVGRGGGGGSSSGATAGRSGGSAGIGFERTTRCVGTGGSAARSGAAGGVTSGVINGRPDRTDAGFFSVLASDSDLPFAGAFSSTIGSRRSPFESASLRTRSAEGLSMLELWLLTPILSSSESSSTT